MTYDIYMTGCAVVRVVGGSIDEELVKMGSKERLSIMKRYPLYEADTAPGVPERFGIMGELIDCPLFPVGTGFGPGGARGFVNWMEALKEKEYIAEDEYQKIVNLFSRWEYLPERIAFSQENDEKQEMRKNLTHILSLICWEKWDELHKYLEAI